MTRACFISDLHLCQSRPDLVDDFTRFMRGPANDCDALYILGDLFEYWIGDDDLDDPFNAHIAALIAGFSRDGNAAHFMAGNRDFLIGPRFAEAAGLGLLEDGTVIELNQQRVLLSHGDCLCTDDHDYQRFRSMVRSAAWQQSFLARPLAERRKQVEEMRRQSEASKQSKPMEIMDVSTQAVERFIKEHDHPAVLIHGHTHRPTRHLHSVDGKSALRIVLSDWRGTGAPALMADSPFPLSAES